MKFTRLVLIALFILALPERAFAQGEPVKEDDRLLFLEGLHHFRDSNYPQALVDFNTYLASHQHSSLAQLYIAYVDFFAHGEKKFVLPDEKEGYDSLMKTLNDAIDQYDHVGCDTDDLKFIARDTIDCPYVAAALYSLRMTVIGQNEWVGKARGDKNHFLELAARSNSLQRWSLLGVAGYKASERSRIVRLIAGVASMPTNREEAIKDLIESLDGNGPLVDDTRLIVFNIERSYLYGSPEEDKKNNSAESSAPHRVKACDEAVEKLLAAYSFERVYGYLNSQYPNNTGIKSFRERQKE